MNRELAEAILGVNSSVKVLIGTLDRVQAACKHEKVLHAGYYHDSFMGTHFPPLRFCLDCLLEEESRRAWSNDFKVITTDFVKLVQRDEIYKHRCGYSKRIKHGRS